MGWMAGYPFRMLRSSRGVPNCRSCLDFNQGLTVIPGCAAWRRPGIHTPDRGYGFRARDFVAPRNDGDSVFYVSTSPVLDPLAAESFRPCGSAR